MVGTKQNQKSELRQIDVASIGRQLELQMSTMLKFKYYWHHVMSRKFAYGHNKHHKCPKKYLFVDVITKNLNHPSS